MPRFPFISAGDRGHGRTCSTHEFVLTIFCKKNTALHVSLLSMRTRRFEVGDLGYEQDVVSIIRHGSSGRHQVRCPGGDTEEIEEHMLVRQCPRLASTADFREAAPVLQVLLKRCTEAFTTMLLYPRSWARYQVTIGAVCERAGPAHVVSWLSVLLTGTCLMNPTSIRPTSSCTIPSALLGSWMKVHWTA